MAEIDQFKQSIGRHLREKRQQWGLTIEKVAEHAETGMDHLGRIERGEKLPTSYTLLKLCRYLELDSNEFIAILDELIKRRSD